MVHIPLLYSSPQIGGWLDLIEPVPVPLCNVLVAGGHSRKVAPCLEEPLAGEKVRERPGAKLLREAG